MIDPEPFDQGNRRGVRDAALIMQDGVTWTASTGGPNSTITGIYTNGNSPGYSALPLAADRVNDNLYSVAFSAWDSATSQTKFTNATKVSAVSFGKASPGSSAPYAVYIYGYAGSPSTMACIRPSARARDA